MFSLTAPYKLCILHNLLYVNIDVILYRKIHCDINNTINVSQLLIQRKASV